MIIHVVKPGDSIYNISKTYGVPMDKIIKDNVLVDPASLIVGQTIVILKGPAEHKVKGGESLYTIAKKYDVTVDQIMAANPGIEDPDRIDVGQMIKIPEERGRLGTILVNGYAYPGVKMETLDKTLPYLTYLSIFGYKVKADGTLDSINDQPAIDAARAAGVAPIMVITNIKEGGGFSSELGHTILSSESLQDKLIDNVIALMKSKNYYGLDVDFEYIYPKDREQYNAFLRKVKARIKPLGYTLSTAIAPKISAGQPGLLYEAHDYKAHGEIADHVIIMTYEWGYTSVHPAYKKSSLLFASGNPGTAHTYPGKRFILTLIKYDQAAGTSGGSPIARRLFLLASCLNLQK